MTEPWTNQRRRVSVDVSPFRFHLFAVKRKAFSHFCLGQEISAACPGDQSASFGVRDTKVEAIYDPIVLKSFRRKKKKNAPLFGLKIVGASTDFIGRQDKYQAMTSRAICSSRRVQEDTCDWRD